MIKPTKMSVRPAKTQISLGIRPVWSESSLCTQWVAKDPSFLHAGSEDSDQTGRMPRLIWVFAGHTATLLVLSCRGSYIWDKKHFHKPYKPVHFQWTGMYQPYYAWLQYQTLRTWHHVVVSWTQQPLWGLWDGAGCLSASGFLSTLNLKIEKKLFCFKAVIV